MSRAAVGLSGWLVRLLGVLILVAALCVGAFKAPDRPVEALVARWAPPPSQWIEMKVADHTQFTH